ncbi:MAG: glycosyltransferase [Microbacteriaceae bacterium]
MSPRPRLLILSFSPIAGDARVLKQVRLFSERYEVTTCGYGEAPEGVARHIRIPDTARMSGPDGRLITLRQYRIAYWRVPAIAWARRHLTAGDWDVVLANDIEAAPVALGLGATGGVHADLHEYSPRLHEQDAAWNRRIRPYLEWICERYVRRADSATTVSEGLAREYERRFGIRSELVTNAAPYLEIAPRPVSEPIRLVHSGACLRKRNLPALVAAAAATSTPVILDLFLTPNDPGLLAELRAAAEKTDNVRVQDPVPYDDLADTLAGYDVGLHVLPPSDFNNANALPNKLFDYVQARLGVVIGPTPEMAARVREFGLGVVAEDFGVDALVAALDQLTVESVTGFTRAADAAARELSAETQLPIWERAIDALAARSKARS